MKKLAKEKLFIYFFTTISLVCFVVGAGIYVYFRSGFNDRSFAAKREVGQARPRGAVYQSEDPYITKNPSLRDAINGPIVGNDDPGAGDISAPVTLVVFSDFECSFCQKQEQVLEKILEENSGAVRLVWKDYPERDEDSLSFKASVAAHCANDQGQFWPFHDALYEKKSVFGEADFSVLAEKLGLDKRVFVDCYNGEGAKNKVLSNIEEADALRIPGIPYIFVNKKELMGEASFDEIQILIDGEKGASKL